jgi:hypothetical protein
MADHVDKQIRDAATTLLTGLTTTGSRVYKSRVYPLQDADLPGLRVFVDGSEMQAATLGGAGRYVERRVNLVVEFCGKAIASYDDSADASKKEIETAIAGDNSLGGKVKYTQLTRIETERDGEGEQVVVMTRLTFECVVYTALNAPDVPL